MCYYLYFKLKNTELQCQIPLYNNSASNLELFNSKAYLCSTFQWFSNLGVHKITGGSFYSDSQAMFLETVTPWLFLRLRNLNF